MKSKKTPKRTGPQRELRLEEIFEKATSSYRGLCLTHGKSFQIPKDCEIVEVRSSSPELDAGRLFEVREYPVMDQIRHLETKVRMLKENLCAVTAVKKTPKKKPQDFTSK